MKYTPELVKQNLQVIRWLAKQYPRTFFLVASQVRPLQHKITDEILAKYPHLPPQEQKMLHMAIGMYRNQAPYQIAVALGRRRRNLLGHKVEKIYGPERERAREWCVKNRCWSDALELRYLSSESPQPQAVD